ncbi:hypothetical protein AB0I77_30205 [Streptomyces sp. NPDC050619]|uniref:hypothetical protein n=1 Tax=Streptomyces sp. NPDC050619 TaxID=3157214 RepID=UPI0034343A6E
MTYNLLITTSVIPDRLAAALGPIFQVDARDVDVADAYGDPDQRNWEALVSCEYTAIQGDVAWSLDIYVQEQVTQRPSEAEVASRLASATGTAVLFPAEEAPPSAYRVATAEGRFTRARLLVADTEDRTYTVDAVEEYVRQLPTAEVTRIPEVVAELPIATPLTDTFESQLRASTGTVTDGAGRTPPEESEAAWYARTQLGAWEKLVNHMASGWAGSGWYPPDLYRRRLEARDGLENIREQLPPAASQSLQTALQQLDATFASLTVEDHQGLLIQQLCGDEPRRARGWWWRRHPEPLPWPPA